MPLRINSSRRDSSGSENSDDSGHSRSTAPTVYSVRPALRHYETDISQYKNAKPQEDSRRMSIASLESCPSTIASEDDLEDQEYPVFDEPFDVQYDSIPPAAYPSSPHEFAELFPSTRRLWLRHDDTVDGNMNLRVDTEANTTGGGHVDLTLFHLRMHDLKNRQFSLRRYCRESGREVCHSSRKYTKPASERSPGLQRSMSNAFASLKSMTESKNIVKTSLKRADSGYSSMSDVEEGPQRGHDSSKPTNSSNLPLPTNTTKIEFSNYAHVDLKRRGTKSSKRYEFEYWGNSYAWRRVVRKEASSTEISYHLYDTARAHPVAHIVPVPMTPAEALEEERKGGWIPPSSLWVSDAKVLNGTNDVAE